MVLLAGLSQVTAARFYEAQNLPSVSRSRRERQHPADLWRLGRKSKQRGSRWGLHPSCKAAVRSQPVDQTCPHIGESLDEVRTPTGVVQHQRPAPSATSHDVTAVTQTG